MWRLIAQLVNVTPQNLVCHKAARPHGRIGCTAHVLGGQALGAHAFPAPEGALCAQVLAGKGEGQAQELGGAKQGH